MVTLCRRRADNRLVIIKTIPVEEMTLEERQAALNEVKVCDERRGEGGSRFMLRQ